MHLTLDVLRGTPLFVWILLAYLIVQGARQSRPRIVSIRRVYVLPCLFVVLGLAGLVARGNATPAGIATWAAALLVLAPLGWLAAPRTLTVDRNAGLVRRPGSWAPLTRMLTAFLSQYAIAVLAAIHPTPALHLASAAISGASAGYFGGWGVAMWHRMKSATAETLRPGQPSSA